MKVTALIPARFDSTRFPGKMLANLAGKSVIRRTYENAVNFNIFDDVYVVTDNAQIYNEIISNGGKALMSSPNHQTGTDRIAEVAVNIDSDIIFNIQGDEPFIKPEPLKLLIDAFEDSEVDVATLMQKLIDKTQIDDPNYVKIVSDLKGFALYFSRSVIPYNRDSDANPDYYEHIGVYAFRKEALINFSRLSPTPLELSEKVEPIRFLEHGFRIKVIETNYMGIEIDTEEDLIRANNYILEKGK
ncbi:MAG: 3-deoxy-manno-octulosonate cytidylyltransferase [Candidatus Kapaibacterium sp.]